MTALLPKGKEFQWHALDHLFDHRLNKSGIVGQASHIDFIDIDRQRITAYVWEMPGYWSAKVTSPAMGVARVGSRAEGEAWAEAFIRAARA